MSRALGYSNALSGLVKLALSLRAHAGLEAEPLRPAGSAIGRREWTKAPCKHRSYLWATSENDAALLCGNSVSQADSVAGRILQSHPPLSLLSERP